MKHLMIIVISLFLFLQSTLAPIPCEYIKEIQNKEFTIMHNNYNMLYNRMNEQEFEFLKSQQKLIINYLPFRSPIHFNEITKISDYFRYRFHPILKFWRQHEGIDFCANNNTKIYPTGSGIVTRSEYNRGYGNYIEIDHGFGYTTRYAHLSKINVNINDKVTPYMELGIIGTTGLSTGTHLHYELRKNNIPIDPFSLYTDKKGKQAIPIYLHIIKTLII
jgi:murein DD-endopeptidase MepM/ murein hydrolase activator NlpD